MPKVPDSFTNDVEGMASLSRLPPADPDGRRETRRALLATISGIGLAGAARLPSQWSRPVVDHVLLPAHAAGSATITACTLYCFDAVSYAITYFMSSGESITTFTLHLTNGRICERIPNADSTSDTNTTSEIYNTSTASDSSFFSYFTFGTTGLVTTSSSSYPLSPSDCMLPSGGPFPLGSD